MGIKFELTDGEGPNVQEYKVRHDPQKSWVENLSAELSEYYQDLKTLTQKDAVTVFQTLSALSARVSEMRSQCARQDGIRTNAFRTKQIEPFLEECDRQFRTHSRIQAIREMEFKLSKGEF